MAAAQGLHRHRNLHLTCLESISLGLATGLAYGLATGLVTGSTNGLIYGLFFGPTFALMIGLRSCSGIYLITLARLHPHARLRFMRFLDYAHRLGLLRRTGTVYQFRHTKLQDRLANTRTSRPIPTPGNPPRP